MTRTSSRIIAITLALMATAAPSAWAHPSDLAPASLQSARSTMMPTVTPQAPKAHANPAQHSVARTGLVPPALRVARRSEQAALHRAEITQHAAVAYRPPADAHYSAADMTAYAIGRVAAAGHTPTIASSGSF